MSERHSHDTARQSASDVDQDLRRRMLTYYDERAPEYEQAYTLGTGTSSITDPTVFTDEIRVLPDIVRRSVRGRLLDLACGTAYWLPHYADAVSHVTLFDQSVNMLASAATKAEAHCQKGGFELVRGDVLEHAFPDAAYDCALLGFIVSHLSKVEERRLFDVLRTTLRPSGRFLVLDSAWTPARSRVNQKIERQQRLLNSGEAFDVYKRYLDRDDIASWGDEYRVDVRIEFFGSAFCAVTGSFV